jgi:hypothetical protein
MSSGFMMGEKSIPMTSIRSAFATTLDEKKHYLAVRVRLRNLNNPGAGPMTTVQYTNRLSHWGKEQRFRKISEDQVGQHPMLLLQALQLFLWPLSVSMLSSRFNHCSAHIIHRYQMDLPYQRLPLKVAALIGDDLPQGRIKFCGVDVPGLLSVRKMTYIIGRLVSYAIA